MRRLVLVCLAVGLLAVDTLVNTASALAQTNAAGRAAAEALFEQGIAEMEAGRATIACPKFEESQRLDPGIGTLLYLADCYDTMGRTASAWATFLEAAYAAKAQGQTERQELAEGYAAALKPKLSKLVVKVAPGGPAALTLTNDGQMLGKPLWGAAIPVDPGDHNLEAVAEGFQPWRELVSIPPGPGTTEVEVPLLKKSVATPEAAKAPDPVASVTAQSSPAGATGSAGSSEAHTSSLATWGWITGAVGAAVWGAGGVVSFLALNDNSSADDACRQDDQTECSERGLRLGDSAVSKANVATLLSGVGLAALTAGGVMVLVAPDENTVGISVGSNVALGAASMTLKGAW